MANRQTRNVSLPPHQDEFIEALLAAGRYRTASEVVRDGLRLLEEAEHRRLLEKWLYEGLSEDEEQQFPTDLRQQARERLAGLVEDALEDVRAGRVADGPEFMQRLRHRLKERDR